MRLFLAVIVLGLCSGCKKSEKPGIWLSFDDRSIDQWYELRGLLNENNVVVTFFITQPDSLTVQEVQKLRTLQEDGHEIGFHGTQHVLSEDYIRKNGYRSYLDFEIDQGLTTLGRLGFKCSSFAYPYGEKYWFTDFFLKSRFDFTRDVAAVNGEKDLSIIDDIYYSFDGDRTLSAIGFDNNSGIDHEMLEQGMKRASENNEVLMLYAHEPTTSQRNGYQFNIRTLEKIISIARSYKLVFYTTESF
jgi:peptidoglycan/xylan/chitin deacetylase (PgdA/CDA1 family)